MFNTHSQKQQQALLFLLMVFCLLGCQAQQRITELRKESWTSQASRIAIERLLEGQKAQNIPSDYSQLCTDLLTAHPVDVTIQDVSQRVKHLEKRIEKYHLIAGQVVPTRIKVKKEQLEIKYLRGGDVAIFTGTYLAGQVWRYHTNPNSQLLQKIAKTVTALHKITHITGKRGFPCRYAFPLTTAIKHGMVIDRKSKKLPWYHIYYANSKEIAPKYNYLHHKIATNPAEKITTSFLEQQLNQTQFYPSTHYYTRTTKDQLTGIIFGLAVAMYFF